LGRGVAQLLVELGDEAVTIAPAAGLEDARQLAAELTDADG